MATELAGRATYTGDPVDGVTAAATASARAGIADVDITGVVPMLGAAWAPSAIGRHTRARVAETDAARRVCLMGDALSDDRTGRIRETRAGFVHFIEGCPEWP
ncbi:hypothetical protein GCM10009810_04500 [Nostocoides vanveenii]|uniref:Uncharacterized protein n=1 Tax=Nostocoides vanveenii TaxID=330835 RepID=A0ABN2K286_9MICO